MPGDYPHAGLPSSAEDYPHSSHVAYLRGRSTALIDPTPVLRVLGGPAAYRKLMLEPCGDPAEPSSEIQLSAPGCNRAAVNNAPGAANSRLSARPVSAVMTDLALRLRVQPAAVKSIDRGWRVSRARALIVFVLVRRLGYSVTAVAQALGRPATSISVLLSRAADRMEADGQLATEADNLSQNV